LGERVRRRIVGQRGQGEAVNGTEVIEIGRETIFVMLKIGAPVMLLALAVGLAIALFQALTSIQEMTLTFVPKIIVIFVGVMLMLPFMLSSLTTFSQGLFDRMIALG
jgi:flagellar biosynthetic protein FliQ